LEWLSPKGNPEVIGERVRDHANGIGRHVKGSESGALGARGSANGNAGMGLPRPVVFVIGCPRSGAGLLRFLVESHPDITVLSDREVMPIRDNRGGLVLVGTRSVYNATDVTALHARWPKAKFLHLVRDARDVVASTVAWKGSSQLADRFSTWREHPVSTAALWWEWQVRLARESGSRLESNLYSEVHYEVLAQDPEKEWEGLCSFLDVECDDLAQRVEISMLPDQRDLYALAQGGSDRTPHHRVGEWRKTLKSEDVMKCEAVAGRLLEELSYPRAVEHLPAEEVEHARALRAVFEGRPTPLAWGASRRVVP
jgi:Sulfotransferase family